MWFAAACRRGGAGDGGRAWRVACSVHRADRETRARDSRRDRPRALRDRVRLRMRQWGGAGVPKNPGERGARAVVRDADIFPAHALLFMADVDRSETQRVGTA